MMWNKQGTHSSSASSCNYVEKKVVKGSSSDEAVALSNGDSYKKDHKLKDKVCYGEGSGGGGREDAEWLSSWPPRYYTCNFCRKRFKSAQALGGHMNVHRRARAMLRSQSISPISSPPSSPWLPTSHIITSDHHHPFQDHDQHRRFVYDHSPNPRYSSNNIPHHMINPSHSNITYLPMSTFTLSRSSVTTMHKNPLIAAAACKHMPEGLQCHHQVELSNREKAKKNCIRAAENKLNGLCSRIRNNHPDDDVVSRLSLGTTGLIRSRTVMEEDIDLELRLGF